MRLPDEFVDEIWNNVGCRNSETFKALYNTLVDNSNMNMAEIKRATVAVWYIIENSINWHTTCVNCAQLMDKLYAADMKLEQVKGILQ